DFSQRMRMGQRLHAVAVDERAIPELEVEKTPKAIAGVGPARRVIADERFDGDGIDHAALTRSAVEEDLADDSVPAGRGAANPSLEWNGEAHLRPVENRVGQNAAHRLAEDAFGRPPGELPSIGQPRGELDELVIEEGHAAFD